VEPEEKIKRERRLNKLLGIMLGAIGLADYCQQIYVDLRELNPEGRSTMSAGYSRIDGDFFVIHVDINLKEEFYENAIAHELAHIQIDLCGGLLKIVSKIFFLLFFYIKFPDDNEASFGKELFVEANLAPKILAAAGLHEKCSNLVVHGNTKAYAPSFLIRPIRLLSDLLMFLGIRKGKKLYEDRLKSR
jgi:hypothetical protein